LDFVFEFHDLINEIIYGDLVVFDDTTNNEFADTVGNWFLLVILFPLETVHLNANDFDEELVEVSLGFVWLDVEQDE